MEHQIATTIWNQFGASIDMLENALAACPAELWGNESKFWYIGYHTLFFLDYNLSPDPEEFLPPPPFTLAELDPSGVLPERVYTSTELLDYLAFCRKKCHALLTGLTASELLTRLVPHRKGYTLLEILLYNMRHVQHHTAQLNLILRQNGCEPPLWVPRTKAIF